MVPAGITGAAPTVRWVDNIVAGKFDSSGRNGIFLPGNGGGDGTAALSTLVLPATGGTFRDASANLPQLTTNTLGGAAGDIDGDGFDDLAVVHSGNPRLPMQIWRNDGAVYHLLLASRS